MRIILVYLLLFSLNVEAQGWQQLTAFPGGARDDGAQFTINDIHYCGTGRAIDFSCKGDFYAYQSNTGSWLPIAPLPLWQERQYTSAFSYDGFGFVVGGENCLGNYFNTFLKYSPLTNSWTSMPDLPAAGRAGAQHFLIGADLFLIGGRNNSGILKEVWCFHFNTNSWEQLNDLPFNGCWRGLCATYNDVGYLFGGRTNDAAQSGWNVNTWKYEPTTDTWTLFSGFTVGEKMYQSMAQQDSLLFIFGGVDPNDQTHSELVQINLNSFQIDTLSLFDGSPRKGCIGFTSAGYFYLSTGISGSERLDETWRFAYLSNAGFTEKNPFDISINFENKQLQLVLKEPMNAENARILDIQGRALLAQKCTQKTLLFELSSLPTGSYFIQVASFTKRFQW
ncbi:MAG: Kelch repeat-containing protein [Flavobacteriales bacterium]